MRQTLDNTRFGSFFKPDFAKKSPQTPKISPAARSALAVRPIAALSHHFGSRAALVRVSTPSFLSQHLVSLGVSTPLLVSQHLPLKADLCLNVHSQALAVNIHPIHPTFFSRSSARALDLSLPRTHVRMAIEAAFPTNKQMTREC